MKLIFDLARTVVICVLPAIHPHRALCVPAALITFSEPLILKLPNSSQFVLNSSIGHKKKKKNHHGEDKLKD